MSSIEDQEKEFGDVYELCERLEKKREELYAERMMNKNDKVKNNRTISLGRLTDFIHNDDKSNEFISKLMEIVPLFKRTSSKKGYELLLELCFYIANETFKQTSDYEKEIKFQEYCNKRKLSEN